MLSRRAALAGLVATGGLATGVWAEAGDPVAVSGAQREDGSYALIGLGNSGEMAFSLPLPGRGHAAARHPVVAEAVAFARRPGRFALVLDCQTGDLLHALHAPPGRHFYGHGAFSMSGDLLFTTENEIATGQGRIGVWDRQGGYARIGEFASGGIGPHEAIRLPGRDVLAVANGGIRTHPDTGREKLNLDTMHPNLTLMGLDGRVIDVAELPGALHQNSLRHIAASPDDHVACGFQWQGDAYDAPGLVAVYRAGRGLEMLESDPARLLRADGYIGSVCVFDEGRRVISTAPRGGFAEVHDIDGAFMARIDRPDICGVAPLRAGGALASDGLGGVQRIDGAHLAPLTHHHQVAFDNHLVAI